MNEPATLTTPWRKFILPPGVGRASLRVGRRRLRAPRWCAPFQREYGGDYRGRDRRSELRLGRGRRDLAGPRGCPAQEPPLPSLGHQDGARVRPDQDRRPPARRRPGNPDFTNAPGHGDDNARFYDRQQAYVHARGGLPRPDPSYPILLPTQP